MQAHHWITLIVVGLVAYYIGANHKLGLPLLG